MTEQADVGSELFIGLVGATGSDLDYVSEVISRSLAGVGFRSVSIRLSDLLRTLPHPPCPQIQERPEEKRIESLMAAGTWLRKRLQRGDALAALALGRTQDERRTSSGRSRRAAHNMAYIFRSLKHPSEVGTLRFIYGSSFFLIAAYCPEQARQARLAERIADTHNSPKPDEFIAPAQRLIRKDESEMGTKYGQNVRETFPLADLFIDATEPETVPRAIDRFMEILFGHPFRTPTRDEYGMFHAQAAKLRSADLSRQVGSVIATKDGDIVAVGANDVPKAGGGLYWSEDAPDRRDYALGYDTSSKRKKQMLVDVIERLKKNDWLDDDKKTLSLEQLYAESLPIMGDAQLMSVGEFGRSVHAEMAALSDAARRGVPVQSGTLYTTTFPCHNCAKHIVASGIKRVVYIEPYAKSLAAGFYEDSILVDGPRGDDRRVSFEPFVGVAPRQYMDLFAMVKRKDAEGKPVRWDPSKASPRIVASAEVYLAKENQILAEVTRLMNEKCFSKTRTKGKGRK